MHGGHLKTGQDSPSNRKAYIKKAYLQAKIRSRLERGWLGHLKGKIDPTTGKRDSVQVEFDPNDGDIQRSYLTHTHPSDNPSPITALPSDVDLMSVLDSVNEYQIQGGVIYSGPYYTVFVPLAKARKSANCKRYLDAVKRGDIEDALIELKKIGFDVETGKM